MLIEVGRDGLDLRFTIDQGVAGLHPGKCLIFFVLLVQDAERSILHSAGSLLRGLVLRAGIDGHNTVLHNLLLHRHPIEVAQRNLCHQVLPPALAGVPFAEAFHPAIPA
ncbi:hypothetical protein D3C81_1831320 [compost metagenome]